MGGFDQLGVTSEQESLLKSKNFSLRPLSTNGHLDAFQVFTLTWQPILIFFFTITMLTLTDFRYSSESLDLLIYWIGTAVLLVTPVLTMGVLLFGVIATKMHSRVRWSAVAYWMYWPFWKFVLCFLAAILGSCAGNYIWYHQYFPHTRLHRLQAYNLIDPLTVSGVRLQDAGVVAFNRTAGVDRSRTGCLKNVATYCVAPIVFGGKVPDAQQEQPQLDAFSGDTRQQYDLFMAGTDCCGDCPGEFRCGDWNMPPPLGGLRVLSDDRREFYKLAAEDWSTTHGKLVRHPIFFEWVAKPLAAFRELRERGNRLLLLGYFAVPSGIVLAVAVLNGILGLLVDNGLAAPLETPLPPPGLGQMLSQKLLPQMYNHHMQQKAQQESWLNDPKYVNL